MKNAIFQHLVARQSGHVPPLIENPAAKRRDQPECCLEGGAFAGPVMTDDGHDFTLFDVEGNIVKNLFAAVS